MLRLVVISLMCLLVLAQRQRTLRQTQHLLFDNTTVFVVEGQELHLNCGVGGAYRSCMWEHDTLSLQVNDVRGGHLTGMSTVSRYSDNECGIVIHSANIEHQGAWQCIVLIFGNVLQQSKDVVVGVIPDGPRMLVESQVLPVTPGEVTSVLCSVDTARPRVWFQWFLGPTVNLTSYSTMETTIIDDLGTSRSVSTLRYTFSPSDHSQDLVCAILHVSLREPATDTRPVAVFSTPFGSKVTTFYEFSIGCDCEVRFIFYSNPEPLFMEWSYGTSFQDMASIIPSPGYLGPYATRTEMGGNGSVTAVLTISQFKESDSNLKFQLWVQNQKGESAFNIMLSTAAAPATGQARKAVVLINTCIIHIHTGAVATTGFVLVSILIAVGVVGGVGYVRYGNPWKYLTFGLMGRPTKKKRKAIPGNNRKNSTYDGEKRTPHLTGDSHSAGHTCQHTYIKELPEEVIESLMLKEKKAMSGDSVI